MKQLLCLAALALPLCAQVEIARQGSEKISVAIDGKPFTEFHIGPGTNKPYLAPLRAATGTVVTRGYPMQSDIPGEAHDHVHHRGLWFTHGVVNGYDFWANEESQKGVGKGRGKIVLTEVKKAKGGKESGVIEAGFDWTAGGQTLLHEQRRMVFYEDPKLRTIDFDITLTARERVTFGDTKEGTFAVRLAPELEENQPKNIPAPKRNGKMVASTGKETEKQVWGTRAEWVDYFGTVHGEPVGIAIMDHPGNPRHPTYWHSRSYGLFAANPFGVADFERDKSKNGDIVLEPGKRLRFRYRVVIHPGDVNTAGIAGLYKAYAGGK
ncbi:MAG TPA: PmoA family protein [Bryobacteraceae bacterium]|nr:PmoA family protein [Bryobacteraceae bacterium]